MGSLGSIDVGEGRETSGSLQTILFQETLYGLSGYAPGITRPAIFLFAETVTSPILALDLVMRTDKAGLEQHDLTLPGYHVQAPPVDSKAVWIYLAEITYKTL